MSVDEFKAFLASATAEAVRELPLDRVPERVPSTVYNGLSGPMRDALESLMFDATSHRLSERMTLESMFGSEVADGIDLAKRYNVTNNFSLFVEQVTDLQNRLGKSSSMTATEFKSLTGQIRQMDGSLRELTNESAAIFRARDVLFKQAQQPISDEGKFTQALHDLENQHKRIDKVVSQYYYVRLLIIGKEMVQVRKRAERLDQEAKNIQFRIDRHREELEALKRSPMNSFQQRKKDRMQTLREIISELLSEKQRYEVLVSEQDLISWLDALVDACISPLVKDRVDKFARNARLVLFNLLERYCVAQEESALQVARNPFTQVDPKKTIRYLLQSEQFILDYFAQKRSNLSAWLGGAAQRRIELLGDLEADLLEELRRSLRLAKR